MWDWGMEQPLRGRSGPAGEEGLSHSPDLPQPRRPQECSPEVQPSLLLGCSRGLMPRACWGQTAWQHPPVCDPLTQPHGPEACQASCPCHHPSSNC